MSGRAIARAVATTALALLPFVGDSRLHAEELAEEAITQPRSIEQDTADDREYGSRKLPAWMERDRIQLQTGLYNFTGSPQLRDESDRVLGLGATSYIRHVKLDWRPPLWPSAIPPEIASEDSIDYVRQIVESARDRGLSVVGYYWLPAEGRTGADSSAKDLTSTKYPEDRQGYTWRAPASWLCRDPSGEPVPASHPRSASVRGYHLDLSSEYREFVLTRLQELEARGVRAVYFDGTHFPPATRSACFGSATEEAFRRTGSKVPTSTDEDDEGYRAYLNFQADALGATLKYWKDGLDPDFALIVSGTYLSSYVLPHMNDSLAEAADVVKVEYTHGLKPGVNGGLFRGSLSSRIPSEDVLLSLGWMIPRDLSLGNPVHVWTPELRGENEASAFIGAVLLYGGIPAIHVAPALMIETSTEPAEANRTSAPVVREAFRRGRALAAEFAGLRPNANVGLLLSERHRNRLRSSSEVWRELLSHVYGAYEVLLREGIPVRIVSDTALASLRGEELDLLVAPPDSLGSEDVARLREALPDLAVHVLPDRPGDEELADSERADMVDLARRASETRLANDSSPPSAMRAHIQAYRRDDETLVVALGSSIPNLGGEQPYRGAERLEGGRLHLSFDARGARELPSGRRLRVLPDGDTRSVVLLPPVAELSIIEITR